MSDPFTQKAGYLFSDRELLNITRLALSRIYTGKDREASAGMREAARQALNRLEGQTILPQPGKPAARLLGSTCLTCGLTFRPDILGQHVTRVHDGRIAPPDDVRPAEHACKCCVDNECECGGHQTGPVTRTGEILTGQEH